jgi:CO/xanthine dehydrogenase FAD-binding subunit
MEYVPCKYYKSDRNLWSYDVAACSVAGVRTVDRLHLSSIEVPVTKRVRYPLRTTTNNKKLSIILFSEGKKLLV